MRRGIIFGLLILTPCIALAAEKSGAATSEAEIRQALDNWAKAFRAHDINGVMSMYAPDVVAYDFVTPLQYVGRDAYRKDYEEFLALFDGPIEVEFRDMKVFAGADIGYVHMLEHMRGTTKGGQKIDFWGRCTSAFRKINGKWLDAHDHCSVPADFDTGKALLDLKP